MQVMMHAARSAAVDDACAGLFAEHFGAMTRLAALLGSDDPEDVAQEAFVRLHKSLPTMRQPGAAVGYLRTTVLNLCRSRLRHLRVARSAPDSQPEWGQSAEAVALVREEHAAVTAAVRGLPTRQREVIVCRYWLGLSIAETGAAVGMPVNTVKSTAARALRAIALSIGVDEEGPDL
jgi:RNA polymerase sigma factor (sigma-70 family)